MALPRKNYIDISKKNQKGIIDSDSSGNNFTGRIASVQVYNRVLTASEIVQNYNATKRRYGL